MKREEEEKFLLVIFRVHQLNFTYNFLIPRTARRRKRNGQVSSHSCHCALGCKWFAMGLHTGWTGLFMWASYTQLLLVLLGVLVRVLRFGHVSHSSCGRLLLVELLIELRSRGRALLCDPGHWFHVLLVSVIGFLVLNPGDEDIWMVERVVYIIQVHTILFNVINPM